MKKLYPLLFLFLFFTSIFAQSDDVKAKVEEINRVMEKAMLSNNPEMTLDYYTDDAISMPNYQPMMRGKEALKNAAQMQKQNPMDWQSFNLNSTDIYQSGDYVIDVGTYDYSMNIPQMEEPYTDKGKYLTVYEKQDDGSLKIKLETYNSDINPWQMMGKDEDMKDEKMHKETDEEDMDNK